MSTEPTENNLMCHPVLARVKERDVPPIQCHHAVTSRRRMDMCECRGVSLGLVGRTDRRQTRICIFQTQDSVTTLPSNIYIRGLS